MNEAVEFVLRHARPAAAPRAARGRSASLNPVLRRGPVARVAARAGAHQRHRRPAAGRARAVRHPVDAGGPAPARRARARRPQGVALRAVLRSAGSPGRRTAGGASRAEARGRRDGPPPADHRARPDRRGAVGGERRRRRRHGRCSTPPRPAPRATASHRWSVEDVAERAGLGRTTVYRRFPSRDDLVHGVLARELRAAIAAVGRGGRGPATLEDAVVEAVARRARRPRRLGRRPPAPDRPGHVLPFLTTGAGPLVAQARGAFAPALLAARRRRRRDARPRSWPRRWPASASRSCSPATPRCPLDDPDALRAAVAGARRPLLGRCRTTWGRRGTVDSLRPWPTTGRGPRQHQAAQPRGHRRSHGGPAARAMLRAIGMTDDDWDKPQVAVASSWNEVTPCNMPLDRAGQAVEGGRARRRRLPDRVHHHRRVRRHLDGPRGHAGLARVPRGHRRLGRDRDARRALRRPRHLRRLRQEPARHAHGRGPAQPAVGVPLRRLDPARPAQRARPSTSSSVFEAVGAHAAGTIDDAELDAIERNACPTEGSCAGMFTANTMASVGEAIGMSLPGSASPAGRRPPPRRLRLRVGPGRGPPARARHPAPPDPDQGGVRERHRRHDGARRLDQRRAAPAGHRRRGPGRARARRLQPGRRPGAAHRRHQAARRVPHGRRRPDRRRAGGACATCSRPACSTATASPSPARRWPRTWPTSTRRRPTARSIHPLSDPIHPIGGIAVLTRLARPEGRGGEGRRHRPRSASRAGPGCSTARTPPWRRSSPGSIEAGDVVVIRYEGPKGGPGHARDAGHHRRHEGRRPRRRRRARSPTGASPAAPTASASATSPPRRSTAARSRSWPRATAS